MGSYKITEKENVTKVKESANILREMSEFMSPKRVSLAERDRIDFSQIKESS